MIDLLTTAHCPLPTDHCLWLKYLIWNKTFSTASGRIRLIRAARDSKPASSLIDWFKLIAASAVSSAAFNSK